MFISRKLGIIERIRCELRNLVRRRIWDCLDEIAGLLSFLMTLLELGCSDNFRSKNLGSQSVLQSLPSMRNQFSRQNLKLSTSTSPSLSQKSRNHKCLAYLNAKIYSLNNFISISCTKITKKMKVNWKFKEKKIIGNLNNLPSLWPQKCVDCGVNFF